MKIMTTELEPQQRPRSHVALAQPAPLRRKPRLMLIPVTGETRLFHAL
ncbi:hypothetical protein [Sandarakinorhabdus sp.]|nr:hypothetical protein [Sandarakinorhabdus sp.]